jgi:hypothetical protein
MVCHDRLKELLSYEPASGFFFWSHSGNRAGCADANGYWVIGIDGSIYLAHRLAWLWMTGRWPSAFVDHANRVKSDNRWENLREATAAQNAANTGVRSTNKSGVKGVSWCKATRKWRATIVVGGKQKSLGRHDRIEDAAYAYREFSIAALGDFASGGL